MSISTRPLGWSSGRQTHHYRSVFPSADMGMQATLHRRVPRRMHIFPTVDNPALNILAGRRIIDKQRMRSSIPKCYRPFMTRLDTDPDELEGDESYRELPSFRSLPMLPEKRFTSADVKKITARLSTFDVSRVPESRGFPLKEDERPRMSRRAYTETEISQVVDRLSLYNPKSKPAESKGVLPESQLSRSLPSSAKKYSGEEVEQIVTRLSAFDSAKWPPESKGVRE